MIFKCLCCNLIGPFPAGVGITNQRETTIMWDSTTGQWLHNAIVWCDNRAAGLADRYIEMTPTQRKDYFQVSYQTLIIR